MTHRDDDLSGSKKGDSHIGSRDGESLPHLAIPSMRIGCPNPAGDRCASWTLLPLPVHGFLFRALILLLSRSTGTPTHSTRSYSNSRSMNSNSRKAGSMSEGDCEVGVENWGSGSPESANPNYYVRVDRLDGKVLGATVVDQEMIQRGATEIEGPFASRREALICIANLLSE